MRTSYLRLITSTYGLHGAMDQAALKLLDLFVLNNSFIVRLALKMYLIFASAVVLLLGDKLSLKLLSKAPVVNTFHYLIITILMMANYNADNSAG
jgi:hypothetical protein